MTVYLGERESGLIDEKKSNIFVDKSREQIGSDKGVSDFYNNKLGEIRAGISDALGNIDTVRKKCLNNIYLGIHNILKGTDSLLYNAIYDISGEISSSIQKLLLNDNYVDSVASLYLLDENSSVMGTSGHSFSVGVVSGWIAKELGCDSDYVEEVFLAGLRHDVGKAGIPPEILHKNNGLTDDERKIVNLHGLLGYEMLKNHDMIAALASVEHHMNGDANKISKIIRIADIFIALREDRPYEGRKSIGEIVGIMDGMAKKDKIDTDIYYKIRDSIYSSDKCLFLPDSHIEVPDHELERLNLKNGGGKRYFFKVLSVDGSTIKCSVVCRHEITREFEPVVSKGSTFYNGIIYQLPASLNNPNYVAA